MPLLRHLSSSLLLLLSSWQLYKILCNYHADELDPIGDVNPHLLKQLAQQPDALQSHDNSNRLDLNEFLVYEPRILTVNEIFNWKLVDIPRQLMEIKGFEYL